MKLIGLFVEGMFWLAIFLSPTVAFGLVSLVVYAKTKTIFPFPVIILLLGMACGVLLAEWVRKKYGSSTFLSRLNGSGEVKKENVD